MFVIPLAMLRIVRLHVCGTYRVSLHHLSFGVSDDHDQLSLESNNQHWALIHHLAHGQLEEKHKEKLEHTETLMLLLVLTVGIDKIISILFVDPGPKLGNFTHFPPRKISIDCDLELLKQTFVDPISPRVFACQYSGRVESHGAVCSLGFF